MTFWRRRTAEGDTQQRLGELLASGRMEGRSSLIVYDLKLLGRRWQDLVAAFPSQTLHAVAVKANPLLEVLRQLVGMGAGLEVASSGELALAITAGCAPRRIVFDSPAKTIDELEHALSLGVRINANSWAELERIDELLRGQQSSSLIGVRLNPVVAGAERESATMVATARSKFGLPAEAVFRALRTYKWLSGLHVHVGSQVATLAEMILGVRRAVEIASSFSSIDWIDIGGGLPTRYRAEDPGLDPGRYLKALTAQLPELAKYALVTEVGRALHSGCGWAISRVEYADEMKAILHLGADFALRTAYQPDSWYHEMTVHDAKGRVKTGHCRPIDLYGPLCFSGDCLARSRNLAPLEPGDYVVLHDIGAYTFAMWSRYCSRPMPEVIGWDDGGWRTLRRAESPEDLVRFWSP